MNDCAGGLVHCFSYAVGAAWRDFWPEDSRLTLDRAIAAAGAGETFRFRARFPSDDGALRYLETCVSPMRDEHGAVVRLLASARDVTAEVETTSFLNTVLQLLPLALTVRDLESGRYVLANPAAEELFDLAPESMVGATPDEVLDAEAARQINALDAEVSRAGRKKATREHSLTSNPTAPRRLSATKVATYDDNGPRHLISLTEDVTQQIADAQALREALGQAEQANRAKSAFLANMSHEFRTPLNGVMAGADMLAAHGLEGEARELLGMIGKSAAALDRRLRDVLELTRLDMGEGRFDIQPFSLRTVIEEAVLGVEAEAAAKGLALRFDPPADLAEHFLGDGGRIGEVLGHLLDNAVKFTVRGEVAVTLETRAPGRVRIAVADTGIGFDPDRKDDLFARFRQQDESLTRPFGGCGLGLTLSRDLAGLMGGEVDGAVRSEGGAVFWLDLPLEAMEGEAQPTPTPAEPSSRAINVLVADDHPTNRRVVELMLGDLARITGVEDGRAAVEAYSSQRFDIVLMDIQMPVMDGLAAVREIRAIEAARRRPRTPIMMLTANVHEEHQRASREAGADRHIGKPFTAALLLGAMGELLDGTQDTAAVSA